jgi:hypothetical protein
MDPTDKIIFICPACQFRARIPAQYAGQTIRCPKCNSAQKVAPPGSDYEASGNTVMISRVSVSEAIKPTARVTAPAAGPAPLTPGTDAFSVPGKGPGPIQGPGPIASSTDSGSIESKLLFVCASCNLRARVPARFGGQTIRCPKCQTPGVVPRTQSVEQSTGATVMITRAQLEAPKPSGSGRWRDPTKSRPPAPAAPPAPAPEGEPVAAVPEPADPAESAANPIDDLDLGAPLETPPEPLAAPLPAASAPAPAAEIEEDPLAEQPPEPRRPGVVHRRGNSSGSIEVPPKQVAKTGKPGVPVRAVKPLKSAPIDPAAAAPAAEAAPKRSPLTLILGILLVVAAIAAAWGWVTAFAAKAESADLKSQLAAEKAQTTKAEKARADAESARAAAEQKAMDLSAQLSATATGATTAAPASP